MASATVMTYPRSMKLREMRVHAHLSVVSRHCNSENMKSPPKMDVRIGVRLRIYVLFALIYVHVCCHCCYHTSIAKLRRMLGLSAAVRASVQCTTRMILVHDSIVCKQ